MNLNSIVIDSSLAAKWYLSDEYDDIALKIKSDFEIKTISIVVPMLFFYEVSNILRTTSKQSRIDKDKCIKAYQDLLDLDLTTYFSKELYKDALVKALDLDITAYDAAYVVLAQSLQIPLYTADEKLVKKAKNPFVKSLKDYL